MSIAVLGNTLTTDAKATGTQALGTVHKQEEDEIKDEDQALILAVLNSAQMRKILANLGYNVEGGEFRFIEVKDIDKAMNHMLDCIAICSKSEYESDKVALEYCKSEYIRLAEVRAKAAKEWLAIW